MNLRDIFKYLVGSYYGIMEMDEYSRKEYVLKDIEEYIKVFVKENPITNYDYYEEASNIEKELSLKTKLQDSLLVLPKVNAPLELILMVKLRLKEMNEDAI